MTDSPKKNTPPGPGIDASGQSVIDPSDNVLALVQAAVKRLDDLRGTESEWERRFLEAELKHLRFEMVLRATHAKEMREGESERLDAIRTVDVGAVATAAVAQQIAATALAKTVVDQAEALRSVMDTKFSLMQTTISELQRFQFESVGGKAQVVESRDSAADMLPILEAIKSLERTQQKAVGQEIQVQETRAAGSNRALWIGLGVAAFMGVGTLMLGVIGVVITLLLR